MSSHFSSSGLPDTNSWNSSMVILGSLRRVATPMEPSLTRALTLARAPGTSNVLASIDGDLGAVHVRRLVRAQEIDGLGDLVGSAEAPHRDLLDDLLGAGRQD